MIHHALLRRSTEAALVAVVLVGLTGCGGAPPAPVVTVTVTPTPSPSPSASPSADPEPSPAPVVAPEPELIPNPVVPEAVPNAVPEPLPQGPAVDLGSTPGARGTFTANADGALLRYAVVEGDSFFDIAQRFNIPVQLLLRMNPSVPGFGENIYINQPINLDWTTTL